MVNKGSEQQIQIEQTQTKPDVQSGSQSPLAVNSKDQISDIKAALDGTIKVSDTTMDLFPSLRLTDDQITTPGAGSLDAHSPGTARDLGEGKSHEQKNTADYDPHKEAEEKMRKIRKEQCDAECKAAYDETERYAKEHNLNPLQKIQHFVQDLIKMGMTTVPGDSKENFLSALTNLAGADGTVKHFIDWIASQTTNLTMSAIHDAIAPSPAKKKGMDIEIANVAGGPKAIPEAQDKSTPRTRGELPTDETQV